MTAALQTARVLITHRPLPPENYPVYVHRYRGLTIVIIDPTTTRLESAEAMIDALTEGEVNYLRAALGEPPVGQPADERWFTTEQVPGDDALPPELVLPRHAQPVDARSARERLQDRAAAARQARSDIRLRRAMSLVPVPVALAMYGAGSWAGRIAV